MFNVIMGIVTIALLIWAFGSIVFLVSWVAGTLAWIGLVAIIGYQAWKYIIVPLIEWLQKQKYIN